MIPSVILSKTAKFFYRLVLTLLYRRNRLMKNLLVRAVTLHGLAARLIAIVLFAVLLSATPFHAAFAQTGSLSGSPTPGFAVLGGTAVTCKDFTITGDVGVYPGSTVNRTNCTINGAIHAGDAAASTAYSDFNIMYIDYATAGLACGRTFLATDTLDGETLLPVNIVPYDYKNYCFDNVANLGGTLKLDAGGNPGAVWIFVIGTSGYGSLTTTNFNVEMINGGQASNVYWWVAEAAILTDSDFQGTLLAGSSISVNRGTFNGNALAIGEVTLTGTNVTATLQSIAVTPNPKTIAVDETTQFTATGAYSDGTSSEITTATWTSGSTGVASISASGLATGHHAGTSTITATYGTVSGYATLTVTAPPPDDKDKDKDRDKDKDKDNDKDKGKDKDKDKDKNKDKDKDKNKDNRR
jgi:hypothetical protein